MADGLPSSSRTPHKEVTNQVHTRPIGPQTQVGTQQVKGVKRVNQRSVEEDVIELMDPQNFHNGLSPQPHVQPTEFGRGRPPDLARSGLDKNPQSNPSRSEEKVGDGSTGGGEGSRQAAIHGDNDVFMQESSEERREGMLSSTSQL